MKNSIRSLVLLTVLLITAGTVRADSTPIIQGAVSGLEICQLTSCGSAIFIGIFNGQVGFNTKALGTIAVAVKHNELPDSAGRVRGHHRGRVGHVGGPAAPPWIDHRGALLQPQQHFLSNGDDGPRLPGLR